jgi:hypothetical protein
MCDVYREWRYASTDDLAEELDLKRTAATITIQGCR